MLLKRVGLTAYGKKASGEESRGGAELRKDWSARGSCHSKGGGDPGELLDGPWT